MNGLSTLFAGVAVTGLIAAGGAAYTATRTINQATKAVGSTVQDVTGVDVQSLTYVIGAADTTTGVNLHVRQDSATLTSVAATITQGWAPSNTTGSAFATVPCKVAATVTAGTGSDISCSFAAAGLSNVNHLVLIAS